LFDVFFALPVEITFTNLNSIMHETRVLFIKTKYMRLNFNGVVQLQFNN